MAGEQEEWQEELSRKEKLVIFSLSFPPRVVDLLSSTAFSAPPPVIGFNESKVRKGIGRREEEGWGGGRVEGQKKAEEPALVVSTVVS